MSAKAPKLGRGAAVTAAAVVAGVAVGTLVGIGGFTFVYAHGAAYLTNDPAACANCHIMQEQFAGWQRSSHHAVAVCNDCHTPTGFFAKYYVKARNGLHHSIAFTTGRFHEPIHIGDVNRQVTEAACRRCHETTVMAIDRPAGGHGEGISCLRCHDSVGHAHPR